MYVPSLKRAPDQIRYGGAVTLIDYFIKLVYYYLALAKA
jgi:hypothetical protein